MTNKWANHDRSELHKRNSIQPLDGRVKKISEGLKERILHYMYVNDGSDLILPESFLSEAGLSLLSHLSIILEIYTSAKVNFELFAENILFKDFFLLFAIYLLNLLPLDTNNKCIKS